MKPICRNWTTEESTRENFFRFVLLEAIPDTLSLLETEPEHGLAVHGLAIEDFAGVSCQPLSVLLPTTPIWQYVLYFHFKNGGSFRRIVRVRSEIDPGTGLSYDAWMHPTEVYS